MALITVQELSTAGLAVSYTTAEATGNTFLNDGHSIIYAKSTVGTTNSIHIQSYKSPVPVGMATAEIVISVSANASVMVGFIDQDGYNDTALQVHMSYTTNTTINAQGVRWLSPTSWRTGTQWFAGFTGLSIAIISVT